MRALTILALAALAAASFVATAQAMTATARVSGGTASVHTGPDNRFPIIGRLADGTEIQVDYCTQTDSDSNKGSWIGDAGHTLFPAGAQTFCRIPDYGWVSRNMLVGKGLVNVTPPDFAGKGW